MLRIILSVIFAALLAVPVYLTNFRNEPGSELVAIDSVIKKYGFYFKEISEEAGVNFIHHAPLLDAKFEPILPQIASMGASVSVVDFDKDGWNDFYVTNSRIGYKNALYHNQKNGSFIEVAKKMGVADQNIAGKGASMGSVWADFDNDGYEDLFVYKWGRPELLKNENGKSFKNVTNKSGLPAWINANTAIWFDYNADGLIDLFIGGYYPEDIDLWNLKTTRILTESFEYSQNGGRNYLFKNKGDGTFEDVSLQMGLTSTRWTLAAGAIDVNNDGYQDLFIANDYGINEFYFNDKGKEFIEQGKEVLVGMTPKSGMNVSFGDTHNQGQSGIYVSNITEPGILLQGNNFWMPYTSDKKLLYVNAAGDNGIELGGWSYGAQFADFNNDGHIDLYVANGYISGEKETSYWYDYSKVTGGNAAIISDIKNWPAMKGRSHAGFQQNRVWLNNGAGHFSDVAKYVTNNEIYDSRAVAVADLFNNGTQDVIVANQGGKLLIYSSMTDDENHWIAFELEGQGSNKSAIGAKVTLYWDAKVQSRVIDGGVGFCSQNQRRVQFGIGQSTTVDRAVITWPNGQSQEVKNPSINKLNKITEEQ